MSVTAIRGFGFDGGHLEEHGLSESGEVIEVPTHRHEISMNVVDVQAFGRYAFNESWFGELRVPFGIRDQEVEIQTRLAGSAPTQDEIDAMIRNGANHHRTETFSGIRDPQILVGRQSLAPFAENDLLLWSAGVTVPLGSTEADPWLRAEEGRRHTHIQLGSGTVDPVISLQYVRPLSSRWSAIATTSGRFPLYENSKTFQGPIDGSFSGRAIFVPGGMWSFDAGYQLAAQGYAHWDGERDENTGLLSHTFELGATGQFAGTRVRLGGLFPVATHLFLDDSDGFKPGPSLSLSVTRSGG